MYTLEIGIFPLAAIVVGAMITLIFYGVVRLRCSARWAMTFIFMSMVMMTTCGLLSPVHWVEQTIDKEAIVRPKADDSKPVKVASNNADTTPTPTMKTRELMTADVPTISSLLHDKTYMFRWLWAVGVGVTLLHLLWQLSHLYRLKGHQEFISQTDGTRVYATNGTEAFSFGRSVFIPRTADDEMRHFMTLHELAHVRHRHLLCLCVFHALLALNWYNPFGWLLLRELHLQQELQVDGDVLSQGVDRTAYQYTLLRAAMQDGGPVWVLSAFGRKPITQRIAFMGTDINVRSNALRVIGSFVLALVVLASATIVACQNNERQKEHPLMGWWKMDFTRNTDSDTELYPFGNQIAFYNHDTFLTITYRARDGKTLSFSFSTEETRLKGDTLVDALGMPIRYKFINENTFQNQWTRQPYQNAMPQGPEITDQWSRIPVDDELLTLFHVLGRAGESSHGSKLQGVWVAETMTVGATKDADKADNRWEYLLVSDSLFLSIDYHQQEPKAFRAAGTGYSGILKVNGELLQFGHLDPVVYDMPDANRLVVRDATNERATPHSFHRVKLPSDLKRMLRAPVTAAKEEY